MGELLPFSMRHQCPKCTAIQFDYTYFPKLGSPDDNGRDRMVVEEHIRLRCWTCGYTMAMVPRDAEDTRGRK